MAQLLIFGYGSLINRISLKTTVPDASSIKPAYIKGFRREFNLWDAKGFTDTNLDLTNVPYCAVDIQRVSDSDARVNGIIFTMSNLNFQLLLAREVGYKLITAQAYNYQTDELIGECNVFSANKNNGGFDFNGNVAQQRYLEVCVTAAREYGSKFYQEFLETTFIDNKALNNFPNLINF